jgi:hypothetical protein
VAKTKAVADAKDKAGPAPTEKRPALEQAKAGGPQRLSRLPMPGMSMAAGTGASMPASGAPRARHVGALQRTIGNARLARMAAEPPKPSPPAGGTGKQLPVQTKLMVGPANDPFEREADAAAGRIAAGQPVGRISRLPGAGGIAAQRTCAACAEEEEKAQRQPAIGIAQRKCTACAEEEKPAAASVQRVAAGPAESGLDTERAERAIARSGPGSPLAPAMRTTMEESFGAHFSDVRVHTSPAADEATRAVNARAFTRGSDIYLARGESAGDPRLMAHELTHTVQQGDCRPVGRLQRQESAEATPGESGAGVVQTPAAATTTPSEGLSNRGAAAIAPTPDEEVEEELAGGPKAKGTGDEEEIEIPSFSAGEGEGCPQLVDLLAGGGEAASSEALRGAAEEGCTEGGEAGAERRREGPGKTGAAQAPAAAEGAERTGPFAQLLNIAVAVVPGGGLLASISGLVEASALQLWRQLPLVARAAAVTRAIALAISGAAFLPRVQFGLFGTWIRASVIAFLQRLQGLSDNLKVTLFEKYMSIAFGQNAAFTWGYIKGLFEGFFVDGLLGIVQMVIDIVWLIGKMPQAVRSLLRFFGSFPEHMQRVADVIVRLAGAMQGAGVNVVGEVQAMFRDPNRILGLITAVIGATEAIGARMGEMFADGLIRFIGQPAERIGRSVGRLGGMVMRTWEAGTQYNCLSFAVSCGTHHQPSVPNIQRWEMAMLRKAAAPHHPPSPRSGRRHPRQP